MVRHVSACLANADLPSEQRLLEDAVAARGWGATSAVFNDTFALLRAGLDEPRGVAVICGAGINCIGPAAATAARCASPRSATSPATGAAAGSSGRRRCGGRRARRTAAAPTPGSGRRCPATSASTAWPALIEAVHLGTSRRSGAWS